MGRLDPHTNRRSFLRFLAASPLLAAVGAPACRGGADTASPGEPERSGTLGEPDQELGVRIDTPDDAVDVFDMRVTARHVLPPAHYGYLATGVDGDATLRANRAGFDRFPIRPRRLVDVSAIDTSVSLLGRRWDTPIVISPCGSQRAFHPDGELATARAARSRGHLQWLSTVTSTALEDVVEARGEPIWYQLYPTSRWEITERLIRRAEAAGSPALVLTVDLPVNSNRLSLARFIGNDSRDCTQCHSAEYTEQNTSLRQKPMFAGTDILDDDFETPWLTWEFIDRLKDATDLKLVVKGIVTREDAERCVERGADVIVVSNHGGRAEESGVGAIECLPEVVAGVRGRVPVLVDSGFRRGVDIFKALAIGADAVCIGRAYLWGLAAFGQPGVERVLDLLRLELEIAMRLAGTPTLADIGPGSVRGV